LIFTNRTKEFIFYKKSSLTPHPRIEYPVSSTGQVKGRLCPSYAEALECKPSPSRGEER
jgi:hypothetical protein